MIFKLGKIGALCSVSFFALFAGLAVWPAFAANDVGHPLSPAIENKDDVPKVAEENEISFSDLDMLILEVNVNGIVREEGIDAYLPEGYQQSDVMIPLGHIAEALSFAIQINPGDGTAKGWFQKEDNTFELSLKTNEVIIRGQLFQKLNVGDVEVKDEVVFIKASLIESWFGVDIELSLSDLVIKLETVEALPFQERLKRELNAQKRMRTYDFNPVKIEDADLVPYQSFSLPSIYVSKSLNYTKSPDRQVTTGNTSAQANFDLFYHEVDSNIGLQKTAGEAVTVTHASAVIQKRDPDRKLLGFMGAGKYSFGDVSYPSAPLLSPLKGEKPPSLDGKRL